VIFQQMNRTIAAIDHPGHGDLSWSDVLPCRGEDEWCAVTIRDAADWTALCEAIGRPEIAVAAPFAADKGPWAMPPDAHAALAAWSKSHAPEEVMRRFQDAGVPAGMMLRVEDLADFEHYVARSVFNRLHQPQLDEPLTVDHATIRSLHLPAAPLNPAPLAGEHSEAIARDLLGLGEDDTAALFAGGILQRPGE
jgi:crotonobetainyl-CoA:carnitine CoA-transferase CaiB-like acyl-CoA transferase